MKELEHNMKKPITVFIPADQNNLKYAQMCVNSLRKFHTEEELPITIVDNPGTDPMFWYRATPIVAKTLLKEFETVIKMDSDIIVFDKLNEAWEGEFDIAAANNSNPRDFRNYSYQFLTISPYSYVNNGFVVIKNEEFVNLWHDFCFSPLFSGFQMKEQDVLNLLVHSGHYKIKRLDEGDSFWNLASKGYEPEIVLKDGKPFLPKGKDMDRWPDRDKYIKLFHSAGGQNAPDKGNYRIKFNEEMVKYIEGLIK